MRVVGLDFGTATTLVAEEEIVYPLGETTTWLPSAVRVAEGRLVAGADDGDLMLRSVKRAIGERRDILLAGPVEVEADQAIEAVLAEALARAEKAGLALGDDVEVRLGCPATWDGAQRRRLLGLARRAGFPVASALVDEPVAAGVSWLAHPAGAGCRPDRERCLAHGDRVGWMLVFDMGGGTLDVAVLRVESGPVPRVAVLASTGTATAGDALDAAIARDLAGELSEGALPAELVWALLERAGREAKERLSVVTEHPVVLPRVLGHSGVIRYDRDRLAAALRPQLDGAQRLIGTALRAAVLADPDFEGVDVALLSGGMGRIPLLARWLGGLLPGAHVVADPVRAPEESVVAGLAHPTGFTGVNHLRPGFDVWLEHEAGRVQLYEAFTPIYEPWQLVGSLALGYQKEVSDLPTAGTATLRVVTVDGSTLTDVPVVLGPAGVALFIGTDTSMVLTDGEGVQQSIELSS